MTSDCEPLTSSNLHVSMRTRHATLRLQILFSSAIIAVFDDKFNIPWILLDSRSQVIFISETLANILQLLKHYFDTSITGFNQIKNTVQNSVSLLFKSNINSFNKLISYIILPKIINYLPNLHFNFKNLNVPDKITLADPLLIDLLIEAKASWKLLNIGPN